MVYNLFIAYDLMSPGQSYATLIDEIKNLGKWHQFQLSLWYVNTHLSPSDAYNRLIAVMDANDRLAVINAIGGVVTNWDQPPLDAINSIWSSP